MALKKRTQYRSEVIELLVLLLQALHTSHHDPSNHVFL